MSIFKTSTPSKHFYANVIRKMLSMWQHSMHSGWWNKNSPSRKTPSTHWFIQTHQKLTNLIAISTFAVAHSQTASSSTPHCRRVISSDDFYSTKSSQFYCASIAGYVLDMLCNCMQTDETALATTGHANFSAVRWNSFTLFNCVATSFHITSFHRRDAFIKFWRVSSINATKWEPAGQSRLSSDDDVRLVSKNSLTTTTGSRNCYSMFASW